MLLIFLDTETTGLNPKKHKPIEIAFEIRDASASNKITTYTSLISWPKEIFDQADKKSLQVHGLTFETTQSGKTPNEVAREMTAHFIEAGIRRNEAAFICQNPSFDRAFFSELIDPDLQEKYNWPYHWLDLASMFWAIQLKKKRGVAQERHLSKDSIATYFGLPKEKHPHRAQSGVDHLIACYRALLQ